MLALAKLTQPDFAELARESGKAQLLIIPYSHFCDFAAWSLELAGVKHEKHCFAPGAHLLPVTKARLGGAERHVSKSSGMAMGGGRGLQAGSETSVPLCVLADSVVPDSWSIATELAGLEPPSPELKRMLDEELGPLARQMAYHFYLKPGNTDLWHRLAGRDGESWWWHFMGWRVTQKLAAHFKPNDAEEVQRCRKRLQEVFATLGPEAARREAELKSGARKIGAGDLALAALASSVVQPAEKCGGAFADQYFAFLERDADVRGEVVSFRATQLGQFSLWMYREHRLRAGQ